MARLPGTPDPRGCYGDIYQLFWIVTTVLLMLGRVNSNQDRCDTIIWDHGDIDLGVHGVTGSCSEGRVDWRNPYGAIRVMLQLRPLRLQKHVVPVAFESCFTVSAQHTSVKIFLDDMKSNDMMDLATLNSSHTRMPKELCFMSEGDPVVVYIESELDGYSAAFGSLQLDYDNRRTPVTKDSQRDECRPCTDQELIESVCSSDFVVTGSINDVHHDHDLRESRLHINVNKVFRQRQSLFRDNTQTESEIKCRRKFPRLNFHTEHGVIKWPANEAEDSLSNKDSSQSEGTIFAPYKCGVRKGVGEFLFIGRIRLKKPLLQCAPRLEDFDRIWKMAVDMEQNMCLMR